MNELHQQRMRYAFGTLVVVAFISPASGAFVPAAVVLQEGFDLDTVSTGVWTLRTNHGSAQVSNGKLDLFVESVPGGPGYRYAYIHRPFTAFPLGLVAEMDLTQHQANAWAGYFMLGAQREGNAMSTHMLMYKGTFTFVGHTSATARTWLDFGGVPTAGEKYVMRLSFPAGGPATMEVFDGSGNLRGSRTLDLAFGPENVTSVELGTYTSKSTDPRIHATVDGVSVRPLPPV